MKQKTIYLYLPMFILISSMYAQAMSDGRSHKNPNALLAYAIKNGNCNDVQQALDLGGSPSISLANFDNQIMAELQSDIITTIPSSVKSKKKLTLLHYAIYKKDDPKLIKTVCQHINLANILDEDDDTLLHHAAYAGHIQNAATLIELDQRLCDQRNTLSQTAAYSPCQKGSSGSVDILKLLHQKSDAHTNKGPIRTLANIDDDKYCLHQAAQNGHVNIVRYLLETRKSCPMGRDKSNNTALHCVCTNKSDDIRDTFYKKIVSLLCEHGAPVDAIGAQSYTPLHYAARMGNSALVHSLLEHNANVNSKTFSGTTPLHLTADAGESSVNIADMLCKKGASLDCKGTCGRIPLHTAAHGHNAALVQYLLQLNPALINTYALDGSTPLSLTSFGHKPNKTSSDIDYVLDYDDDIKVVEILCSTSGVRINTQMADGATPSHRAARKGYFNILSYLLSLPAIDVNIQTDKQETVLHCFLEFFFKPHTNVPILLDPKTIATQEKTILSTLDTLIAKTNFKWAELNLGDCIALYEKYHPTATHLDEDATTNTTYSSASFNPFIKLLAHHLAPQNLFFISKKPFLSEYFDTSITELIATAVIRNKLSEVIQHDGDGNKRLPFSNEELFEIQKEAIDFVNASKGRLSQKTN